jgi:hypothetical protein
MEYDRDFSNDGKFFFGLGENDEHNELEKNYKLVKNSYKQKDQYAIN